MRRLFRCRVLAEAMGLALLSALAVAGCAAREPERAAMVPQAATGDYGYSEQSLAPDRARVTFMSPRLPAGRAAADAQELAEARGQVHDLALWRAAELTLAKGFRAFAIERDDRDTVVTSQSEPLHLPGGPVSPYHEAYELHWPYVYWPDYWAGRWEGDPFYTIERTRTAGRIIVKLTVKMLPQPTAGALDAAETAARLRRAYGSFRFPEAQAE